MEKKHMLETTKEKEVNGTKNCWAENKSYLSTLNGTFTYKKNRSFYVSFLHPSPLSFIEIKLTNRNCIY